MRWLLFVLIAPSSYFITVRAQNPDSLRALVKNKQLSDTLRILAMTELAYEFRRSKADSSLLLAKEGLSLAEKLKFIKGKSRALRVIGIYHYLLSNYPQALSYYEQALDLALKTNDRKNIANCYNNIGTIYHSRPDYKKATMYFLKSLEIRKQINDQRGVAQTYANLATVYQDEGNLDGAMEDFVKSQKIYEQLKDKEGIASSYRNIGTVYRNKGDSRQALNYFLISLEKRREVGPDQHGIAFLYNDLGSIYKEQGDYEKALQYFFQALKIQESIGSKQGIAASHNNIGNIYKDQGNFDKALEYLTSSMKLKEEIGSRIGIANSLNEIGTLHMERLELEKARENMKKSLAIREEVGDRLGIVTTSARLAEVFIKTKEYPAAFELLAKAQNIATAINTGTLLCDIDIVYASYFNAIGKYEQAYQYSTSAFGLATKVRNIDWQRKAAEQKSIAAEKLRKYQEALESHKLFLKYNDSIQNLNSIRKSLAQEFLFREEKSKIEAEKKELMLRNENEQQRRIAYTLGGVAVLLIIISLLIYRNNVLDRRANKKLRLQKEEIELAHDELEKSDAIKNRLLSIISHDVRGPLNSLRAMLYLFDNQNLNQNELKEIASNVGDQVGQLNFFLDNLLRWTNDKKDDVTPTLERLDVGQLVKEVVDLLMFNAQSKKINLETNLERDLFVFADDEMLKVVLRNLLTNAIKFCKKNDFIRISSAVEGSMARITVEDTGMGIPAKDLPRLFGMTHLSTRGTKDEIGTGLGLALCKEFVGKNGGHIVVKSEEGKGSRFEFTVPLADSK